VVIYLEQGADDATASQNLIISCLIIQTGFTFLLLAYPGCPGKEAVKLGGGGGKHPQG